jgi:hypothetical protein
MNLGGHLTVKAPGLKKEEIVFCDDENGVEFILKLDSGDKEEIVNFNCWVRMPEDKVKINNDVKDGEVIDTFYFDFENEKGQGAGLTLSLNQAIVLREMLELYIRIYNSYQELKKERTAKVAEAIHEG